MARSLGHRDVPLDQAKADHLNIGPYAKGLQRFVEQCQTPLTIGLQGEWGSGKTSLMRLVQSKLKASEVETFWFETRQYGAMGDADTLGMHLMADLTGQLMAKLEDGDRACTVKQKMGAALKAAFPALLGAAASATLRSAQAGEAISAGVGALASGGAGRTDMRGCFQDLVEQALSTKRGDDERRRLVAFIDDLDRVRPPLAVRLLEVLKNFMDVERCVFVVAWDDVVVREGVQELMGIGAGTGRQGKEKVDAFFHKLFQVQFLMSVGSYEIDSLFQQYLEGRLLEANPDLLARTRAGARKKQQAEKAMENFLGTGFIDTARATAGVGARFDLSRWFDQLKAVVHVGVGTNPRAFERFLNLVDLTACVDEASGTSLDHWSVDSSEACLRTVRWCTALFPIVALQQRWPEVAPYLLNGATLQTRAGLAGPDAACTDFERRLRTLAGRWPDADEETIDVGFADERIVELVAEHDCYDDHETPALTELRRFCKLWFDLLNDSKLRDLLTPDELEVIGKWSQRLGKMGTTSVSVSGLARMRLTALEIDPNAGDGFVALASCVARRVRDDAIGQDLLRIEIYDDEVKVQVVHPTVGARQILKFKPINGHLEIQIHAKEATERSLLLPGMSTAGAAQRAAFVDAGFQVIEGPPQHFKIDYGPGHRPERNTAIKPVMATFRTAIEAAVLDLSRAPQPLPTLAEPAVDAPHPEDEPTVLHA